MRKDLTSGGAADLANRPIVRYAIWFTRLWGHPGHYCLVDTAVTGFTEKANASLKRLQEKMETEIPHMKQDQICTVCRGGRGKDKPWRLRRSEVLFFPIYTHRKSGGNTNLGLYRLLRRHPWCRAAFMLLEFQTQRCWSCKGWDRSKAIFKWKILWVPRLM